MRERTGAGAFAPERRAHGVSRVPVGCLARLPGSLAREHVSNGDHSVCRVRMIMCVSVQVSARERERERAGIQGECGSARNGNARVSRYRYFAFTSVLLTPITHIHMNLCSARKAGGERKGKRGETGSAFGIGIAAISRHSHRECGEECNRWNAGGMRSNGKDGMQGNQQLANAGISRLYSLALYLTSMHTHMHNEYTWICKGM